MRPSWQLLLLLLVWVLLGLLVTIGEIFAWDKLFAIKVVFWGYLGTIATLALLDGISLGHKPVLQITRTLDPHLALGVRQRVTIKLDNLSGYTQSLWLTDFPPAQLHLDGLPVALKIEPGTHALVRYWITPLRRGLAEFLPHAGRPRNAR